MSIFVIGINNKTAPLALREKVFFAKDKLSTYLQDLVSLGVEDVVLLSTCNRSELYCDVENFKIIEEWFYAQAQKISQSTEDPIERHDLGPFIYIYQDERAIAHMMQVACGLDSMVLGEVQILGQMKEAFAESLAASAISPIFHRLFQQVFAAAKEIRTTTAIGACPVSLVSAASQLGKLHIAQFAQANVVVIGAGETSHLLLRYLHGELDGPITLINRNLDKAMTMIQPFKGKALGLSQLKNALSCADLVFSATSSITPIINEVMMEQVMALRDEKPIVMIDIAVPRDIDMKVAAIKNVLLFCIDDLKVIVEQNRKGREHAALKADEMIWQKSRDFIRDLASWGHISHTISAYRKQIESLCSAELQIAKYRLHQGIDPQKVLDNFAYTLTQKLLHTPSVRLRKAGREGRFELLNLAKQLFAVPDPE